MFHVPERYRVMDGVMQSIATYGNNGQFRVRVQGILFLVQASDGTGWEHVSVSLPNRCPSWEEMCAIKTIFWDEEDVVMQLHPRKSQYVTMHPYCLHLWRPNDGRVIPEPHSTLVGPRKNQTVEEARREFQEIAA